MRRIPLAVVLAMMAMPASGRPVRDEAWVASSTTAMGITGDIRLSPHRLLAAGHAMPLRVVADVPAYRGFAGPVAARVLAFTPPADPPMLRGNRLGCGRPLRWLVAWHTGDGELVLDMFDSVALPRNGATGLCATYVYARR